MSERGSLRGMDCSFDVRGKTFKVAAFGLLPYVQVSPNDHLIGANINLMNIIGSHLQMKMAYTWKANRSRRDHNGHLRQEGVIGQVYHEKADIGLGGLVHNIYAFQELSLSQWTDQMEIVLCCFKPRVLPSYLNILLAFTLRVWLVILSTNILICLTVELLGYFMNSSDDSQEWILFLGLLVGQGHWSYDNIPKSIKIPGLFTLVYSFLMEASFSCNLRAHLVEKQTEEVANSLEDILRLNRIYCYPNSPGLLMAFQWHKTAEVGRTYGMSRGTPPYVLEKMEHESTVKLSNYSCRVMLE